MKWYAKWFSKIHHVTVKNYRVEGMKEARGVSVRQGRLWALSCAPHSQLQLVLLLVAIFKKKIFNFKRILDLLISYQDSTDGSCILSFTCR